MTTPRDDDLLRGLTTDDFPPPPAVDPQGRLQDYAFRPSKSGGAAPPGASKPVRLTPEQAEKELRNFDLNQMFGPCVGLDRNERWERAKALGLDPPHIIKEALATPGVNAQSVLSQRLGVST
mmetsp:Transcript_29388/g.78975  ORF Transcript_29388/g.78975 Transcript_29388/m.78975 type:complete len:122 (+) Transcript_29388:67-432(+)|eukprot:CAMPEP_0185184340 /NCGR_PEP_ID=MMETSP1140-20130426/2523_1 /TAXON_ID=298111 /ORGANISM="Pavlova sp., Strain CCMP459" /LENGTH=121 /DNA_ID=CAMNT_0027750405 /DNA_START=67 /DNA_END=432 /DNA_ORIENTATION=+